MGEVSARLAGAVNYTNAGTVEFLLDRDGNFYFLEMNTRIQVEHPVTEEVTGLNLIAMQFDIAAGRPLAHRQNDIRIEGHAIEARLCAEDPADNFRPQLGRVEIFNRRGVDCRVDAGVGLDSDVTGNYDSMIAKVIAKGANREVARAKLIEGLMDLDVIGLRTNKAYLADLLRHTDVVKGAVDIGWLERQPAYVDDNLDTHAGAMAALYLAHGRGEDWSSTGHRRTRVRLRERDKERDFVVEDGRAAGVSVMEISLARGQRGGTLTVETSETRIRASVEIRDRWIQLDIGNGRQVALFEDVTYAPAEPKGATGANIIRAPMAGRIVKVMAEPGTKVAKNQLLVILEAMKMEHELRAAVDGVVQTVSVKPGDQVAIRQTLVTLVPGTAGVSPAL